MIPDRSGETERPVVSQCPLADLGAAVGEQALSAAE